MTRPASGAGADRFEMRKRPFRANSCAVEHLDEEMLQSIAISPNAPRTDLSTRAIKARFSAIRASARGRASGSTVAT
jgi:hypothetical protein